MREKVPAFIIAAAKSGSGKTTLTLGIVAALVKRGLEVQCFKCGPDFIDPTLHRAITFKDSYNLDLRMMGAECCRHTFAEKSRGADAVVVEGVMGLFDG
ncbi:MAG: cobyrinate a,c-diamide synthase, partial [Desulfobulbaceae bacterium]